MKKFTFLIILTVLAPSLIAQEMKQLHFAGKPQKLQSGEMVARCDQNGNYCAAIQVISDMSGFSYDSWDGIVGDIDSKPGQDMVFLTATERVMQVFKTGYKPLKIILSDEGINLQAREVWQITIAGDEAANMLPVTFRFTPEDAKLFIDGKAAGTELTMDIAIGQHTIKLEKDGYKAMEKTISVDSKNVFFELEMEKAPDAIIEIATTPPGATFYLDGIKMGETPFSEFFKPGTYPVKITKEGFVTLENITLEVKEPKTSKSYNLEENVGYLTINTSDKASVFFNGSLLSNPVNVKLPPQLVKVKVTQSKAEPLEDQVVLKRNDRIILDMYPEVKTGNLQIAVTPFDAKIELTGDAGEYYTAKGTKFFIDLPVGTYTVKVSAPDYETITQTVVLQQGQTEKKSIKLSEPQSVNVENKQNASTGDYGIEMVFVKGGTFTMGCTSEQSDCQDNEKPVHKVTLDDFYIGKYEVTQKQWVEVMGNNPSKFKGCDDCPVEQVSWNDIQGYIKKLNQLTGKNYRLPSEAEWEYAARGGLAGSSTKYAGSNDIDKVAWYDRNSDNKIHLVGQKQANELGVYDMSGGVWEWCSDLYGNYSSGSQTNPNGSSTGSNRVLRGGSFNLGARRCLVVDRGYFYPAGRNNFSGFRLVLAS